MAGHVLQLGHVDRVTTIQRGGTGGSTLLLAHDCVPDRPYIENAVVYALGGRAAEEVLTGTVASGAGGTLESDLALATIRIGSIHLNLGLGDSLLYRGNDEDIPRALSLDPVLRRQVDQDLNRLYGAALTLIQEHRLLVENVASELMEHRNITGERFREIVEGTAPQSSAKMGSQQNG